VLAAFLHPWGGTAIRHIPAGSRFDGLDTRFAGLAADNRWNEAGEPTFCLAGDLGVAIAEYARHLSDAVGIHGTPPVHQRAVYQIAAQVEALLDLRDPRVRSAIGLHGGARRFLDRGAARATAHFLRRTTSAEGLLVPSVAFFDDPSRWNLVLFLDKLPADVTTYMSATFYRTVRITS
jgi:RES domain-containing protein